MSSNKAKEVEILELDEGTIDPVVHIETCIDKWETEKLPS
jgi:hypothetical protein